MQEWWKPCAPGTALGAANLDSLVARMHTVYTMHTVTLPHQPHWFSKARPLELRRQDEIPAVSGRDWLRMSLSRFNDTFVNFWWWTRAVYTRREDGKNVEMAVTDTQCVHAHGLWLYVWQAWDLRVLRCSFPHTNFQWCYIIFRLYSRRPWPSICTVVRMCLLYTLYIVCMYVLQPFVLSRVSQEISFTCVKGCARVI